MVNLLLSYCTHLHLPSLDFFCNDNLFQNPFSSSSTNDMASCPSTTSLSPTQTTTPMTFQSQSYLSNDAQNQSVQQQQQQQQQQVGATGQSPTTIIVIQPGSNKSQGAASLRKPNDPIRMVCSKVQIQPKPESCNASSAMESFSGVLKGIVQFFVGLIGYDEKKWLIMLLLLLLLMLMVMVMMSKDVNKCNITILIVDFIQRAVPFQVTPQVTCSNPSSKVSFFIPSNANSPLLGCGNEGASMSGDMKYIASQQSPSSLVSNGLELFDDVEVWLWRRCWWWWWLLQLDGCYLARTIVFEIQLIQTSCCTLL